MTEEMSRRSLLKLAGLGVTASVASACAPLIRIAGRPQLPGVSVDALKKEFDTTHIEELSLDNPDHVRLYHIADAMYDRAKKLEGVTNIPPRPRIFEYRSEIMTARGTAAGEYGIRESGIFITDTATKALPDNEKTFMMAHEIAHFVLRENPELYKRYLPPNLEEVLKEAKDMGLDSVQTTTRVIEMVVDQIAGQLSCDPEAARSAFDRIEKYNAALGSKARSQMAKKALQYGLEEIKGFKDLPVERQSEIVQESIEGYLKSQSGHTHPSYGVRSRAIQDAREGCTPFTPPRSERNR